jgi:hypothetical protein
VYAVIDKTAPSPPILKDPLSLVSLHNLDFGWERGREIRNSKAGKRKRERERGWSDGENRVGIWLWVRDGIAARTYGLGRGHPAFRLLLFFFFIAVIFRFTAVVLIADERYTCCCLIALTTLLYCSQDKAVKISRSEIEIEFLQEAFIYRKQQLPTSSEKLVYAELVLDNYIYIFIFKLRRAFELFEKGYKGLLL